MKTWGDPEVVASSSEIADSPHVTMDSSGSAFATWQQFTSPSGIQNIVFASHYSPTTGWGSSTALNNEINNYYGDVAAVSPRVFATQGNNKIIVWKELIPGPGILIYADRYLEGTGWEPPTQLAGAYSTSSYFTAAFGANGQGVAVWVEASGSGQSSVWASYYSAFSTWSAKEKISTSQDMARVDLPLVSVSPSGDAIVTWYAVDSSGMPYLYENHYSSSGWAVAAPFQNFTEPLTSPTALAISGLSLGSDAGGNAIVVYGCGNFTSSDANGVFARRYVSGVGWEPTIKFPGTTSADFYQRVTVTPDGGATAVWAEGTSNAARYYATRFSPQSGWSSATTIDSGVTPKSFPILSTGIDGSTFVIWQQTDSANSYSIQSNRYFPNQGWSGAAIVGTNTGSGTYGGYDIATDGNGNATVVWAFSNSIYANHFH